MIELACNKLVFHFNKKFLTDPTIPMWVVKTKGETYYVEHVESNLPWSTKETPDNSHTKGSLQLKNVHLIIRDDNTAILNELTDEIKLELKNRKKFKNRYIIEKFVNIKKIRKYVEENNIPRKTVTITAECSTPIYILEFKDEQYQTLALIQFGHIVRQLMQNESYYKLLDKTKIKLQHKIKSDVEVFDRDYDYLDYDYD